MILKKIKQLIKENRSHQLQQMNLLKELEWANVYHDSIRGIKWLENTPLNIGRWAGNYAFFYLLKRILNDAKPTKILELGLGESSKFISKYLDHYLIESQHTIIEHDEGWKNAFKTTFQLNERSRINICPPREIEVYGCNVTSYSGIEKIVTDQVYDLYLVDGPIGSESYSRYDIISLVSQLTRENEFIIVVDDTHRKGEKETFKDLVHLFQSKDINIHTKRLNGSKELSLIATEKYKFLTTV